MRDILKAGMKVGMASLVSLLGSMVAGKVIALQLGAAGVGLFGLLRQLLQNLTLAGSFNGQTGLVQGIASRPGKEAQDRFTGSVLWIQILISGSLAAVLVLGAPWLGPLLIPHPDAVSLMRWLALAMLIAVAQAYVIGILNGYRMIDALVKSQMKGPAVALLLVFPMVWLIHRGHPFGFVLMLTGPAAIVLWSGARACSRAQRLPSWLGSGIHRDDRAYFFRMSTVLTFTAVVATGTQFGQSWLVAKWMGLAEAGQFWTAWTLSMSYVSLILGSVGTYYMPSLSRLSDPDAQNSLIRDYLRLTLLAMPVLVSMVIVFKPWVIRGLFSTSMLPALKVMRWMLIGDFFKGISYIFSFSMVAFNDMKWFFWTDSLFSLGMAGFSFLWVYYGGGIAGLGMIFMVTYIVFLLVMVYYIYARRQFVVTLREVVTFFGGLAMIGTLSACSWSADRVHWSNVGLLMVLVAAFTGFSLIGSDVLTHFRPQWEQLKQKFSNKRGA